jgi:hypothetical protein
MTADYRPYQGADLNFMDSYQAPLDTRGDILCYNQSGIDIPPYAPMKLNGSFTGEARQVIRPDEDSLDASLILFNGPHTVGATETFTASSNYESLVKINGTPSVGDDLGTKEDQWYLDTTTTGFKARGVIQEGLAYAVVFSGGAQFVYAEQATPGNVSITTTLVNLNDEAYSGWDYFTETLYPANTIDNAIHFCGRKFSQNNLTMNTRSSGGGSGNDTRPKIHVSAQLLLEDDSILSPTGNVFCVIDPFLMKDDRLAGAVSQTALILPFTITQGVKAWRLKAVNKISTAAAYESIDVVVSVASGAGSSGGFMFLSGEIFGY